MRLDAWFGACTAVDGVCENVAGGGGLRGVVDGQLLRPGAVKHRASAFSGRGRHLCRCRDGSMTQFGSSLAPPKPGSPWIREMSVLLFRVL